ncbi:hypothetical protein ACJ73_01701 [Blastomyces percursus]|uniref:Amidase domain-containing protein n=1 Tax=Blastomyces percursus TaxID=1658174 RepID=A0A1J9RH15_9EURO|nr:hypothetical protein ACJ73_01701 [Blastomyces percursus]
MFVLAFALAVLQLFSLSLSVTGSLAIDNVPARCCHFPSLVDTTLDQLQAGLSKGCFTSVNAYIGRIADVNSTLQVVAALNPDAIAIARRLDVERKHGKLRGPLHGLPVLIKGNIGVADKMNTTSNGFAASWLLCSLGAELPEDSTIVAKLRESGVVILEMAGLSEWANFRSSNSSNGLNAYGGQVAGAYVPRQDPSGSSSGSGVASDLGLSFATLGTEVVYLGFIFSTSLHIARGDSGLMSVPRRAAASLALVNKTTLPHMDTIGPMTRTVKDAAKLLQVIAGPDSNDNYTSAFPFDHVPNYVAACQRSALNGMRIGLPTDVLEQVAPEILENFHAAVKAMTDSGAIIVNCSALEESNTSPLRWEVISADFVNDLANYFSKLKTNPNNINTLSDLRNFTQAFPLDAYPDRDTGSRDGALALGYNITSPEFWPKYQKARLASIGSGILGSPIVTVPMGAWPAGTEVVSPPRDLVIRAPEITMGLSFLGDFWSEATLIVMAYAYEQQSLKRRTLSRYIEPKTELKDVV